MKLGDLRRSGHAPSLVCAFLHFDISFMIWVILGALMPFITTDPALTGQNLRITPGSGITRSGQVTLLIKGPQTVKENPKLRFDQAKSEYNLILKPGDPGAATRASVVPLEKYVLDNSRPETLTALNRSSTRIHIELAAGAVGNPNENVVALQSASELASRGAAYQPVANGYPAATKLTLIAIPLLAAAFWRILVGVLTDRFGARRVGIASLALTLVPLVVAWLWGGSYNTLVFVAVFLGLAGASFAISLPLASRWYPPHLQGLAMGIAGAGNSGTVLATLFAPMLARALGWHLVFGLLIIPVVIALIVFATLAKDPPGRLQPARTRDYAALLAQADTWWFCLFYFVTFGGFVGLASFINTFFVDQYNAPKAAVGLWTWPLIIAGSFLRPVGGALSDRLGGLRMLTLLYSVVIACSVGVGLMIGNFPVTCVLLFILMGALGMGNGSVFQLVPQRFRERIGVLTGLVGAAGGVGGFYLNVALGSLHDNFTGSYASGFYAFAAIALVALTAIRVVSPAWTVSWLGRGGIAQSAVVQSGDTRAHTGAVPVLQSAD